MMFINGCELVRADFHLHTRKDKEFKYTGEENSYITSYIEAMEKQNIRVGVITNHNKFDLEEYRALRKQGARKEIFILPGIELSVKEGANGIHILIVFNPDDWLNDKNNHIDSFLTSAFYGIENRENENTRCRFDLPDTLSALDTLGKEYFIIFAHIEQNSGFVKECAGGLVESLSMLHNFKERVLAFQKFRTRDNEEKLKQWLGFERAFVEGSDPKMIADIGKGKKTFIKIGSYSYAAVKYALQDYKNRLFTEHNSTNHAYIADISFTGGKLNGITVNFSPELNTLIGIRGSGKSSILEAIRYSLDIDESAVDGNYKKELVKSVLGSGGEISVHLVDKYGKKYESKRIYGEKSSILDEAGNELAISVHSIVNNPLYFGQKDLSFTQTGYELDLLQKLIGDKSSEIGTNIDGLEMKLANMLHKLSNVLTIPSQIKDLEEKRADLEHKLKVFEEKGVAAKLKKQTSCNNDIVKLDGVSTKLNELIIELKKALMVCTSKDLDLFTHVSEFNSKTFEKANKIIQCTMIFIKNIETFIDALELEKSNLDTTGKELLDKVESLKEEFAEIKREIQDDTLDPDRFVEYTSENNKTKKQIDDLIKLADSRSELIVQIKECIKERNEALQNIFKIYQAEIYKINSSQSELKIDITFKGNKSLFKEALKNNFKGTFINDGKYQQICDTFYDFVAIVEDYYINNGDILKSILTDGEYAKLGEKIEENYGKLIVIRCPNLVKIFYHGKLLEQHSIGQRASALILFILTQNDNDVIIIDQPEDDLDNQVIYKEVIHTIKAKKAEYSVSVCYA